LKGHRSTLAAIFVIFGGMWMTGCATPSHDQGEHYVFVATNIGLPYWKEAEAGFIDAAKALGVKGELVGPTGYQPNAELGVFRNVVEERPAGICISAARPEIFQAHIDNAIAKGIPVICVDSDVPSSNASCGIECAN
jgi:ribose transport system substrate-binding protein